MNNDHNGMNGIAEKAKSESEEIESVDTILANELNKLSFHERELINDEIHGIGIDRKYIEASGAVEETPDILSESLDKMQTELDLLRKTKDSFAFNRSQELYGSRPNETYLNESDFRLMFLRCERFDCKKAAERLCRFADLMHEVYGDFALQRQIRLSDLDDEEREIIESGWNTLFPGRDRAGRRIQMHVADNRQPPDRTRLRISAYTLTTMIANDVSSQRRGFVAILWYHNVTSMDIGDFIVRGKTQNRLALCIPVRMGAGHLCFPTIQSARGTEISKLISKISATVRPHVRIHSGSPMECVSILESFGICSQQNPFELTTGKIDLKYHKKWLKLCVIREENPDMYMQIIEWPNHSDVLSGRGQNVMDHPGNRMFRDFVHKNLEVYSKLQTKSEATRWTWNAVRELKTRYGARFLKEEKIDNDVIVWKEVSNEIARGKVRVAFRDARFKQQQQACIATAKIKPVRCQSGKKPVQKTRIDGRLEPKKNASMSSSLLSKRKNEKVAISDDFEKRKR